MPEFAVELRDVSKRFPGPSGEIVSAVKNVSMQIRDGVCTLPLLQPIFPQL